MVMRQNLRHTENHDQIFEILNKDVIKFKEYVEQFLNLQEIYDFAIDWETNERDK